MEDTKVVAKAHIDIVDAKDAIVEPEMMAETLNPVDIAVAVEVLNRVLEVERLTHHLTEVEQMSKYLRVMPPGKARLLHIQLRSLISTMLFH